MNTRRAVAGDAAMLAALNAHVHDSHVAAEPYLYHSTRVDEVTSWFAERLRSGDVCFLAESAGEAVGYVIARLVDRPGHLFVRPQRFVLVDQIAVAPAARRQQVGRALMAAVDDYAMTHGVEAVELAVRSANPDAIAFYQKLGFGAVMLHLRRPLAR